MKDREILSLRHRKLCEQRTPYILKKIRRALDDKERDELEQIDRELDTVEEALMNHD
jgi:hypothetical protein